MPTGWRIFTLRARPFSVSRFASRGYASIRIGLAAGFLALGVLALAGRVYQGPAPGRCGLGANLVLCKEETCENRKIVQAKAAPS